MNMPSYPRKKANVKAPASKSDYPRQKASGGQGKTAYKRKRAGNDVSNLVGNLRARFKAGGAD